MTSIQIYGRNRAKFQSLFPQAIFEGYECNIRFCYFSFKNKISHSLIQRECKSNKIQILDLK